MYQSFTNPMSIKRNNARRYYFRIEHLLRNDMKIPSQVCKL